MKKILAAYKKHILPPHTKNDLPSIFMTLLIIVGLPLTILTLSKFNTEYRSKAAELTSLEAESGTITGNVSIISDSSVSGGKYAMFTTSESGSSESTTSFQPTAPYYATFFYLWYKNPNTDSSWSYWTDSGNNAPTKWFAHYLPDPLPNIFDPAQELYSNNDYATFKWQAAKLAEAKQEVAIASWFGQNTKQDIALKNILNDFMSRTDNPYPHLRWVMYYEDEGFGDPSVATLVDDLTYIKNNFAVSKYFLKVNNKPVLFVYGASEGPSTSQRWKDANTQLGNYFYIVLKVYTGWETDPNQPDSWHQYAPSSRLQKHAPHSMFVSPGFWKDDGSAVRLGRNLSEFQTAVSSMVNASVTWKLVQTWNEWGEGSSVEPGQQTMIDSTGKEVLDPNGTPFGNLYIDVLRNSLPPLEQGTGAL
jgi:hypothetical protein